MSGTADPDARTRARIEEHWKASESGDIDTEHAIYADDGILDYPQSGERFRGRAKIQAQRGGHPAERHFTILRISGGGDLWVSECIITYSGAPSYSVSIMEFTGGQVSHETQYFADPFPAASWRAELAEPIPPKDPALPYRYDGGAGRNADRKAFGGPCFGWPRAGMSEGSADGGFRAHTGNDETCPRRHPASPAHQSLQSPGCRSACRAVRAAGPGQSRQVRPRPGRRRGRRHRLGDRLRFMPGPDHDTLRQADQALIPESSVGSAARMHHAEAPCVPIHKAPPLICSSRKARSASLAARASARR
jgi:hypothetical protein